MWSTSLPSHKVVTIRLLKPPTVIGSETHWIIQEIGKMIMADLTHTLLTPKQPEGPDIFLLEMGVSARGRGSWQFNKKGSAFHYVMCWIGSLKMSINYLKSELTKSQWMTVAAMRIVCFNPQTGTHALKLENSGCVRYPTLCFQSLFVLPKAEGKHLWSSSMVCHESHFM